MIYFCLQLGKPLGDVILNAFSRGLDIEKFHVVGHSLGGQLAGLCAKEIINKSNGQRKLKRLCFILL